MTIERAKGRIKNNFGIWKPVRDHFEQKETEETEKDRFVFCVSSVDSIEVGARKDSLDTPSASFSSLKLMISPSGISSSFI